MAKRKKQYRGVTTRKGAKKTAISFIGNVRAMKSYVERALDEGNCQRAVVGLTGMARDEGIAAAYRYESGKTRQRYQRPVANLVTRTMNKVIRECELPASWKGRR
jgi:hypothetical protein